MSGFGAKLKAMIHFVQFSGVFFTSDVRLLEIRAKSMYNNKFSIRILVALEVAIRKLKCVFFTLNVQFVVVLPLIYSKYGLYKE